MAHMAPFAESDFDSIHSSQAFIGDHQVMYTPPLRAKKASRFASTQSYILPDIPNTSQIVGGDFGDLPKMRPSVNENQIVNALTRMQKQLDQAKTTIRELMRERDEYRGEAKLLRQILTQTQRSMGHKTTKSRAVEDVDMDLLDFTQYSDADDDFTQQLPTLHVPKAKSNLKAAPERVPPLQQKPHQQIASKDAHTPRRTLPRHSSRLQQNQNQAVDPKRQPLREISESQYQQRFQPSPQRAAKKVVIEDDVDRDSNRTNTVQTNARAWTRNITYLSNIPDNQPFTTLRNQLEAERLNRQRATVKEVDNTRQDTARSTRAATAPPLGHEPIPILEDKEVTATSNTSRRRRRASDTVEIDDGMTSAYLLPDITIAKPQPQSQLQPQPQPQHVPQPPVETPLPFEQPQPGQLSEEAKDVLHSVDPDHIVSCVHCKRLLRLPEKLHVRKEAAGWDWCMVLGDS
jgi:hypothetical protein